jgi:hypothetical protein
MLHTSVGPARLDLERQRALVLSDALLGGISSIDERTRYRDVNLALETVLRRPDILLDREGFVDGEASVRS